jgi:hypothetical protein
MRGDRPFSEFTYAFAATHELARLNRWWSRHTPIIPSLSAEGRLGYDVRFDLPGSFLFIQFKLAKERENLRLVGDELRPSAQATQLRTLAYGGLWQFWTSSHQHRLLTRLAAKFDTTYYLAPRFRIQAELNGHFARRSIARSSFIVRADAFPGPRTDRQHRHRVIGPKAAPSRVFIFSEAVSVENLDWRDEMTRIARNWPSTAPLGIQLTELWKELPGQLKTRERRLNALRRAVMAQSATPALEVREPPTILIPSRGELERGARATVSRRRLPPWEDPIHSYPVYRDLGGRAELVAKLMIVTDELAKLGITTAIAQPSASSF